MQQNSITFFRIKPLTLYIWIGVVLHQGYLMAVPSFRNARSLRHLPFFLVPRHSRLLFHVALVDNSGVFCAPGVCHSLDVSTPHCFVLYLPDHNFVKQCFSIYTVRDFFIFFVLFPIVSRYPVWLTLGFLLSLWCHIVIQQHDCLCCNLAAKVRTKAE